MALAYNVSLYDQIALHSSGQLTSAMGPGCVKTQLKYRKNTVQKLHHRKIPNKPN